MSEQEVKKLKARVDLLEMLVNGLLQQNKEQKNEPKNLSRL